MPFWFLQRLRKHRALSLLPATIWLLSQLLMTGVVTGSSTPPISSDAAVQTVVMCTGTGFKTVKLPEKATPNVVAADKTSAPDSCKWCQSFCSADTLYKINDAPCIIAADADAWYSIKIAHYHLPKKLQSFHIRAPPPSWI